MSAHYADRLHAAMERTQSPVCVGIDPRPALLPTEFRPAPDASPSEVAAAIRAWGLALVDVLAPLVPIVKPQIAFFEAFGFAGFAAYETIVHAARQKGLMVLADAKRGDIGSTAEAYAQGHLDHIGADAVTVNAYLGMDTLEPFLKRCTETGKGIYVLVRTSNPGARDLQDLSVDGQPVHTRLAARLAEIGAREGLVGDCGWSSVGAVTGATYPAELAALRDVMPQSPFLVPGYGAQGGSAADCAGAFTNGEGAVVNSSRGITFAYRSGDHAERFGDADWRGSVEAAVCSMRDALNVVRRGPAVSADSTS